MTTYTEPYWNFESVLYSEEVSFEEITVVSGAGVLSANSVLGKITKAGTATSAALGTNTGNGTMGTVTVSAGAIAGDYVLTIIEPATNLGNFTVEDPNGVLIGHGTVGSAFSAGGLAFTLADGSTDFVAGDQIKITVTAGSGKYTLYDDGNTNGSEVACAILMQGVDASTADQTATAMLRIGKVAKGLLQWHASVDSTAKATAYAQLKANNSIIAV